MKTMKMIHTGKPGVWLSLGTPEEFGLVLFSLRLHSVKNEEEELNLRPRTDDGRDVEASGHEV